MDCSPIWNKHWLWQCPSWLTVQCHRLRVKVMASEKAMILIIFILVCLVAYTKDIYLLPWMAIHCSCRYPYISSAFQRVTSCGWVLISQFSPLNNFLHLSEISKHYLHSTAHACIRYTHHCPQTHVTKKPRGCRPHDLSLTYCLCELHNSLFLM